MTLVHPPRTPLGPDAPPSEARASAQAGGAAGTAAKSEVVPGAGEPLFPAFLRLQGRKVVLVGGGTVAAAKHAALAAAGADITVVSPRIAAALRTPGTTLIERGFAPEDLDGAWFVVAAATPEVNRAVLAAALPRRLFVNAVDDPPAATAFAGSVARRGPVTIAVSTGGSAPALAALVREGLESLLPQDLGRWTEVAALARQRWRADGVPITARRPLLLAALNDLYAASSQPRPVAPPLPAAALHSAPSPSAGISVAAPSKGSAGLDSSRTTGTTLHAPPSPLGTSTSSEAGTRAVGVHAPPSTLLPVAGAGRREGTS
jgi:uroporphyrin-III C-methyltransferase / precorrin-2 dehydrogenase / sirohydrochlorin ferrochelatase